jgi:hypothetical protein
MPIAKSSGGTFEPAPQGTHPARCFGMVSLGTQHSDNFPDSFKVMLMWELPEHTLERDGESTPMVISKEYTCSLNEKANLRRDLVSWRGREFTEQELAGFNVATVVGAPCLLNIIHAKSGKGSTYAKIASISPMPKKMAADKQVHESVKYEIEMGRNEIYQALPEWVQRKINLCVEWNTQKPAAKPQPNYQELESDGPPESDDVPF